MWALETSSLWGPWGLDSRLPCWLPSLERWAQAAPATMAGLGRRGSGACCCRCAGCRQTSALVLRCAVLRYADVQGASMSSAERAETRFNEYSMEVRLVLLR